MTNDKLSGDLFSGAQLRDDAMQRAIDHADDANPDWSTRAYRLLRDYATRRRTFTTEELRAWAHGLGFPLPAEPRAWGGVVHRARKAGVIVPYAMEPTANPRAHCRKVDRWRSTLYP